LRGDINLMKKYKAIIKSNEEVFEITSNVEIFESDSFVLNGESYYVYDRQGNILFVKPITKTVCVF
jgi:hypothetical protein